MKLDSFKVPVSGAGTSSSKSSGTYHKSPAAVALHKTAPVIPLKGIAGEERRRSQRVLLRVRASIHVALNGKQVTFEATTLSVNTQGAMLVLKQNLPMETRLVLEHGTTRERVACKVARPAKEMPEGYQIPIEFDSPSPDFWKIAFPPADWRPEEA